MIAGIYSFSEILHIYFDLVCLPDNSDDHPRIFRRIMDGVRQQVSHHPSNLFTIYKKFRNFFFRIVHFDITFKPVSQDTGGIDCISDQLYRLGHFRIQLQFAGFHLCHLQQFARNIQQTIAIFLNTQGQSPLFFVQITDPPVFQ